MKKYTDEEIKAIAERWYDNEQFLASRKTDKQVFEDGFKVAQRMLLERLNELRQQQFAVRTLKDGRPEIKVWVW